MLHQTELLELTDEDLLNLIDQNVVIRISQRESSRADEDEDLPFKTVTSAGRLLEIQYSADTGGVVVSLYSGTANPDELKWDCNEYRADFIWECKD